MNVKHPLEFLFMSDAPVWAARISKVMKLDLQHTLDAFSEAERFIVSEEGTGIRLHQHLLISGKGFDRVKILEVIKKAYPAAKGNKNLYVKIAENFQQLLKYTVKEGNYMSKGFTNDLLETLEKLAVPKTDIRQKFTDLEDIFLLEKISFNTFVNRYVQLKIDHGQNLYNNHLIAYFRRMGLKTGYRSVHTYCEELGNKFWI